MSYRDQSYKTYERDAESNPFRFAVRVIVGVFGLGLIITAGSCVFGLLTAPIKVANQAAAVAFEEFGPRALLQKYEWFKDAAAALDKKRADVGVYDSRVASMHESYGDAPRKEWAREDREQLSIWQSEVAGIKASYNQLAAEYNAQMAKFNWRFAERGNLPPGASMPLPREYKPYMEN